MRQKEGSGEPVFQSFPEVCLRECSPLPLRGLTNESRGERVLILDYYPSWIPGTQFDVSPPSRRSSSYIVCNTTSSEEVLAMEVTVQVDRAKIHQDLVFQYMEDPTIVRIEPEWSIVR